MNNYIVYKYPFSRYMTTITVNDFRPSSRVVLVAGQYPDDPVPTIWIEHDLDDEREATPKQFVYVGTGMPHGYVTRVGSAVCAHGNLVWHVYEDNGNG